MSRKRKLKPQAVADMIEQQLRVLVPIVGLSPILTGLHNALAFGESTPSISEKALKKLFDKHLDPFGKFVDAENL